MGLWTDIIGATRGYIVLAFGGVRLKNSSGNLSLRNAADSADAQVVPQSLGTGTRNGTKFLQDDGTWVSPSFYKPGASWTTPTRSIGVTYTNNTGYFLGVAVYANISANSYIGLKVGTVTVDYAGLGSGSPTEALTVTTDVPPGATYEIISGGTVSLAGWAELG